MSKTTAILDLKMQSLTTEWFAQKISGILRSSLFSPGKLAHRIKSDPRAFKNYWDGDATPPAAKLVMLMAEVPELHEAINDIILEMRNGSLND